MAWLEIDGDHKECCDSNEEQESESVDCMMLAHLERIEELLEHMIKICDHTNSEESVIAFHERKS